MSPSRAANARRSLVRRVAIAGSVLLGLGLVAWIGAQWVLGPPRWYAPPSADDVTTAALTAAELGERVEYRLAEELQRVRPAADRWTIRLTDEQVNAWLATRLPGWWRTERGEDWPERLGVPQIRTAASGIDVVMAADVAVLRAGVTAELRPVPAAGTEAAAGLGRTGFTLAALRVGHASGAASMVADAVIEATGAEGAEAEQLRAMVEDPGRWLDDTIEGAVVEADRDAGHDGAAGLPVELADGRRVRVIAIGLEAGALTVTFVAEG